MHFICARTYTSIASFFLLQTALSNDLWCTAAAKQQKEYPKSFSALLSLSVCLYVLKLFLTIPPATPFHHQQHLRHPRSAPGLPPQDHHSQDDTPPPHLERASSTQDLQPQRRQLQHIPFIELPELDLWSHRLGEKTVKQFEELARNFAEQDTIEDTVNWNEYLSEQLKDEQLVDEYNVWSEEYFRAQPPVDNIVDKDPSCVFGNFQTCLRHADWNAGGECLGAVSSMMLYGHRLYNKGLFVLGPFQRFWLILQLRMWPISPQKTDPQLRELYGVADSQPREVLSVRYKPIGDESTTSVLFFFPLGKQIPSESRLAADHHRIYPPN